MILCVIAPNLTFKKKYNGFYQLINNKPLIDEIKVVHQDFHTRESEYLKIKKRKVVIYIYM